MAHFLIRIINSELRIVFEKQYSITSKSNEADYLGLATLISEARDKHPPELYDREGEQCAFKTSRR